MKRDMELVRKLLIFFDDKENPTHIEAPPIDGYDEQTIQYHLVLMYDAELLRCEPVKSSKSERVIYVLPFELTWKGHDFLDSIRNDTIWKKVKDTLQDKGLGMAFSVVQGLAVKFMQSQVGLS
ncbi:DUF2513 domain-containing protein [Alkalimonas amylolytica]|uniref:DUF2513 domain-containing protein n=1 Tax=Alkalimonas amylolytica TaxID=152573 RepID=A0A1H3ZMC5_ALKAM|nr:DUF2513 domain-containing protein [Alkalimonas amylolytica]SEA24840.1 Hypothetical protein SAMN04488051_102256 [Alkalimonas amylolytica]